MLNIRYILIIALAMFMAGWLCLLTGQRNASVEIYAVPKESAVSLPKQEISSGPMRWQAPEHWIEQTPSGMRVGSFLVNDEEGRSLDISIISLFGQAGGLAANVNRWRGQIGLASQDEEEIEKSITRITINQSVVTIVDIKNSSADSPAGIFVAIVPHGDYRYFFKMTGPYDLIEKEKPSFTAFLETVNFG